jgi:hypothetical protein
MQTTLLDTRVALITRAHEERFSRIDAEDFSLVMQWIRDARFAEGAQVTLSYLEYGVMSLKQYYAIMVLDPLNAHAAGPFITQFWHVHKDCRGYNRFCKEIFGRVIGHTEIDAENTDMVHVVRGMYRYTRDLAPRIFDRAYIDGNFWPQSLSPEARITCYQSVDAGISEILQQDRLFELRTRCSRGPGFRSTAQVEK